MEGFDEVIKEFLVESYESLDQLDGDLIALEDAPEDRDRLASIFRTVHTIKGTSGFLALPKLERVAHVGENLLVPLRDGELRLNGEIADGLLGMVDAIREILGKVESNGAEGETDFEPLITRLQNLLETGGSLTAEDTSSAPKSSSAAETANRRDESAEIDDVQLADVVSELTNAVQPEEATASVAKKSRAKKSTSKSTGKKANSRKAAKTPNKTIKKSTAAKEPSGIAPPELCDSDSLDSLPPSSPQKNDDPVVPEAVERSQSVADATVRIDVELLDKLMNLVGELVLSRNQILQFCSGTDDATMVAASQRLNLITTELQEGVMKTRMQPIRNAWSKLPRVVRDLSASCGKKVEVCMEGADTELDKTILEAIKDPLTHIVRNSVDHGIESEEVRVANGKPAEGLLQLRAFHEGGQVNIEIVDDGAGINTERVREKALEKGLVTSEQAASMSDRELTNLVLIPGFSTAAKVTNVSGRGVGMDVVKTNIERIGGTIDIQSTPGQGTTLRIKIPLTLAIVPALIVKTGGDSYAIPQVSLLELVRLDGERAKTDIEFIHEAPVYRLRGDLLPLVYLDEQLGLRGKRQRNEVDESINIVVLKAEDRQFGLVVDAVTDTQEIVVKPLGRHLKSISAYAGATIMGDGSVALILDVLGVAQKGCVLSELHERIVRETTLSTSDQQDGRETLLIVDQGDGTRAAIQLSAVARLEKFDASNIERSGQSEVIQYRGDILPLIRIGTTYGATLGGDSERLPTVVHSAGDHNVGVIVGKIIDIVHEAVPDVRGPSPKRRVIQGQVTELVDLTAIVHQSFPGLCV